MTKEQIDYQYRVILLGLDTMYLAERIDETEYVQVLAHAEEWRALSLLCPAGAEPLDIGHMERALFGDMTGNVIPFPARRQRLWADRFSVN
jgi:hypothetical protein